MSELKNKNLIKKYTSLSAPMKASMWFLICTLSSKGIALITTPIFTRILSTTDYGIVTVYNSWSMIISIFATLNLSAGVFNNGMNEFPENRLEYSASMQGLSTTVTLGLLTLYLIFQDAINSFIGLQSQFIYIMFFGFLMSPALAFWSMRQRFDYKYRAVAAITLINTILTPTLAVIAVLISDNKVEAKIFTTVIVGAIISLFIYIYTFIKGKRFFVKKYWKFALLFNLPLIPHYLSMNILSSSDRIMIERMVSADKAGIYGIAYTVSMLMTIITSSINTTFIPWTYKTMNIKGYKQLYNISKILILVVFVMVSLSILFAPEVIKILAPSEYYEAIWIIPPVAASILCTFLYTLFGNIEFYYKKTKFVMVASCVGALLNIGLNYLLIPIFGYMVAGYTTFFCYLAFVIMHGIFMHKVAKEKGITERIYDIKFFIGIVIAIVGVMLISLAVYDYIIIRYSLISIILLILVIFRSKLINVYKEIRNK